MKVPVKWLKDYVKIDKSDAEIAASFTQLGLMLDKPLDGSGVLDLEHRMDRSDWLSIVGCARDLAAYENLPLTLPKLYSKAGKTPASKDLIQIKVETPHVRRFDTRVFKGIKVTDSPDWLKERLTAYGIEPKNNIVDITNFVMVELGQPMHAQDLAQMKGQDITIRAAKAGEKILTLLGTEIKLDPDTFVLTSGGEVTVIGGIVGGKNTGVTEFTTDIILDAGNYDQAVIRKTSRRLKIINETVSRYDKFLDPRLCAIALDRATKLILELAGGTYYANFDYYPEQVTPKSQTLTYQRLSLISGMKFSVKEIKRILKSLEYVITEESETGLSVEIPYFRTDIEVEDDLIADILRISNYANIPLAPLSTPVPTDITPSVYTFEDRLRDILVGYGAHEHITSSLVKNNGVKLANALSTEQNTLRKSLLQGLTNVLNNYRKHGITDVNIFELGIVFSHDRSGYHEHRHLSAVGIGTRELLSSLLHELGITYQINNQGQLISKNQEIGKIDNDSFTLYTEKLVKLANQYAPIISGFSHTSTRDLSIIVPKGITYFDIINSLSSVKGHWQKVSGKATILTKGSNYLLSFTWNGTAEIENDLKLILAKFKEMGWESRSG